MAATLIRPPPKDPNKSAMENTLELTQLSDIDPDLFTNTRQLWHPPGARGVYGGSVIAQCLAAAQRTVPHNFTVHSMHCYFVLAGNSEIPIVYHVEHVREGKSFATRTVQARQRGKPIFTTTLSFMRQHSGGKKTVEHATPRPDIPVPPDDEDEAEGLGPWVAHRLNTFNDSGEPYAKRTRQWIKARGKISQQGGHEAHLEALAYMSDSFFIGTVARVHRIIRRMKRQNGETIALIDDNNGQIIEETEERPEIGMMVSLDHTIFFHRPREFRADDWLFTEMDSPWAGDGRGVVTQKIWDRNGYLIATCFQEGLVRLKQDSDSKL